MDLGSAASVGAYASQRANADVREEASLRVLRMALDGHEDRALQLIESVTPAVESAELSSLGQHISVRA
ncbi:putative motility protein [Natronospirillum operosum]|uniref:Putative motility protein n=1 Tax=Natronospirillum operosum TaxID=2759953 RepID=A0A4Z0WI75_9GAMM|nr:YjfB family protein [Natronospirillum operosum]TGG95103.1 putative motility protein [Natronospirillum operosum]